MSLTQLKWLRFITPGILIVLCSWLVGRATGLWGFNIPDKIEDALPTLTVIIPAGIYYLTPFRSYSNNKYFSKITGTLRRRMLEISGVEDNEVVFPWIKLRGIFFSIIDSDKSLEKKASLAYFNGYIWTTLADIRVISLLFSALSGVFWLAGAPNSGVCTVIFLIAVLITFPASKFITNQHIEIGEEQIEIIEQNHLPLLREKLEGVRARSNIGSD